ncbi:hypothetical protein BC940DRAFT_309776 [Gongronella butleri]|nr:hypothetical protein BC940DRAFT_309776 [Gongronella butleri]
MDPTTVDSLQVNDYESQRRKQIEENKALLKQLGLAKDNGSSEINELIRQSHGDGASKKRKMYANSKAATRVSAPPAMRSRLSRRLRGEAPDESVDLTELMDERDRVVQLAAETKLKRAREREEERRTLPKNVSVPFTLASIGTTIWEVGSIYTGEDRDLYWSSSGCRYKHPYPVGFRASKSHFGNSYTMTIEEGAPGEGPLFTVRVNDSQTVFKGPTPTAPWTDACIKSKSPSTRVSGPLFYGFSDLLTMKLVSELDNYDQACTPDFITNSSRLPQL